MVVNFMNEPRVYLLIFIRKMSISIHTAKSTYTKLVPQSNDEQQFNFFLFFLKNKISFLILIFCVAHH